MKKYWLFLFSAFAVTSVFAKGGSDTTHNTSTNIGSRFFFPNSLGLSVPFENKNTSLRDGFALNAGVEYRPQYINAFFYKIDLDILNNNYTSFVHNLATNIIQGKLSSDFILAGAGYRAKAGRFGVYGEILPGLGMRSYDRADISTNGVLISRVTNDNFSVKCGLGLEYYLKKHFDVFFEPSYYKLIARQTFGSSRSQILAFTIGVATARF